MKTRDRQDVEAENVDRGRETDVPHVATEKLSKLGIAIRTTDLMARPRAFQATVRSSPLPCESSEGRGEESTLTNSMESQNRQPDWRPELGRETDLPHVATE